MSVCETVISRVGKFTTKVYVLYLSRRCRRNSMTEINAISLSFAHTHKKRMATALRVLRMISLKTFKFRCRARVRV